MVLIKRWSSNDKEIQEWRKNNIKGYVKEKTELGRRNEGKVGEIKKTVKLIKKESEALAE